MKRFPRILSGSAIIFALAVTLVSAQRKAPRPQPAKSPRPIIFGVVNDGAGLEPIGYINKGKLEQPVDGSADPSAISAFIKTYYKTGTTYRLIFGGGDAGTVRVASANGNADCAKNMATVKTDSSKVALKGFVMGLATNAPADPKTSALRRRPTTAEKTEIEALVKEVYERNKLTPKALHYQNLTAIDVDGDGKAELVGSYWVEVDKLTRALLFFIADKHANGKYAIDFSDYRSIDQTGVMSSDISDVDKGIYHELLVDYFDVDKDGTAEIFTYTESFEGAEYNVYKRSGTKWTKNYTFSNYHCGY